MSAIPIVPGLLYQVRIDNITRMVSATNPVDAICIVLDQIGAI